MLFSFSSLTGLVPVSLCLNQSSAGSVFSGSEDWRSIHLLSGLPRLLVDRLHGFVPVWLIIMPSTSWNRFFRCFEDCRVKTGSILVDTVLGEDDRFGVEVSEFPEALPVRFLVVPTGRQFSCNGVDLLGEDQDSIFVVASSKLLTEFSFGNLLNVVSGYGNIRCAGCFHTLG